MNSCITVDSSSLRMPCSEHRRKQCLNHRALLLQVDLFETDNYGSWSWRIGIQNALGITGVLQAKLWVILPSDYSLLGRRDSKSLKFNLIPNKLLH
ncbi:hypothetical protein V6N11_055497 [Hibiscus sabdariffa]|uniref:Uncharacterized protein n=1 Tax=Hibiscus sabdariffa TaxID=183260 RepID=A0ABR2NQQ4_9ROSI